MERKSTAFLKVILLITASMPVMAGALVAPALPALENAFSTVPSIDLLSRLVLTLPAFFIGLVSPFAGFVIDRFGRTTLLKITLTIYGLAGISIFFLNDIYLILIARALMGLSVGSVLTTVTTLIGDFFKGEERSQMLGYQAGVMAFGATVFTFVGGFLAEFGWEVPFAMYGLALVMVPLVHFSIPEPESGFFTEEISSENGKPLPIILLAMAYGMAFIGMSAFYLMPTQIPFVLADNYGQTGSVIGITLAIVTMAAAIVSTVYGRIKNLVGNFFSFVFAIAFLTLSAGFFIISGSTQLWQVMLAMVFCGLGAGLIMPNANTWISYLAPASKRGRLLGLLSLFFFWGQFFSPIIFEPIRSVNGTTDAFGIVAIFLVVFTIIMVTLVRWRLKMLGKLD